MTSFDYRLNPIYAIKECSSCGSLYTSNCGCSKGSLEDKILVPIPDSSQRSFKIENFCLDCGNPIHGLHCQGCALIQKTFEEVLQDFQDTSESSDDNTNVVNAPREPIVVNQDPGENSSPSPLHIDQTFVVTSAGVLMKPSNCDVPLCNNTTPLNALNEHYEIVVNSDDDNSSSDDNYPYGEDIDYVDASSPDVEIVSLEVVEIINPEVGRIDNDILLTIKDDILREKLLNVNLLIAKIDSLRDNPTPSSKVVIKSTSTLPNLFLEETNTFDNSIPESETFRFNLEEISSGSPTTHSELSLPDYKAFYVDNDHFKERSSGSTTTHVDFSQYDSFIFDLSINPFPPADRSDFYHEEFADELAHIISSRSLIISAFNDLSRGWAILLWMW
ncbi:hypothetical protein Tco_1182272 [Tanacetum coccineum]